MGGTRTSDFFSCQGSAMRGVIADKEVLDLVEHIYAAGCDPSEWPVFARRLHQALPGTAFTMHLWIDGTFISKNSASGGYDPDYLASYASHYHATNPYIAILQSLPVGKAVTVSGLVSREWLEAQSFYHEWLKPAGDFSRGAGIVVAKDKRRVLHVNFDIPESLVALEEPAARLLSRLAPHMARAFDLNERLGAAHASHSTIEALIDTVDGAAILIDASGRISGASHSGEALLRAGQLTRVTRDRRLTFRDPAAAIAYERALKAALDSAACYAPHPFIVRDPAGNVLITSVLPLRPSGGPGKSGASTAMLVVRPDRPAMTLPGQLLQALYRLTDAEAAVTSRIVAGEDISSAAEALGISRLTARNQLSVAMAKIGVRRQAELVARVAALRPGLRAPNANGGDDG
jgi:DNA-binding CsgD family transcriptional regulator